MTRSPEEVRSLVHGLLWFVHTPFDEAEVQRLIEGFYRPFTALRNQVPGYGVALTKAALRLRGWPSGRVRPPLVDPLPEHAAQLAALLERGLALIA